jgi:hypothetical protein
MEKQVTLHHQTNGGYKCLYNYELVAFPSSSVLNTVLTEKLVFSEHYLTKPDTASNTHITIAQFQGKEEMEETLIRYMQRIFYKHQSFEVLLNNYSGIPAHTIYLRVQNQQPFRQISKEIQVLNHYITEGSKQTISFNQLPRLSIATNLAENVYNNALVEYSKKLFHHAFKINELVLLRTNPPYQSYQAISIFSLKP